MRYEYHITFESASGKLHTLTFLMDEEAIKGAGQYIKFKDLHVGQPFASQVTSSVSKKLDVSGFYFDPNKRFAKELSKAKRYFKKD